MSAWARFRLWRRYRRRLAAQVRAERRRGGSITPARIGEMKRDAWWVVRHHGPARRRRR